MTTVDENLNGLELISGKLVTLFLTYDEALIAAKEMQAGSHVKVTNDPNPDLNGEYTWDGLKLVKTTNNTLEKAAEEAEKLIEEKMTEELNAETILDILNGQLSMSELDRNLQQRLSEIPSISGDIEALKEDANKVKEDIRIRTINLNRDLEVMNETIQNIYVDVDGVNQAILQEVADRIAAVQAETDARIAAVQQLNDGLTEEIQHRKDGDQSITTALENYKASNDQALANVQTQVTVAVDTANAASTKVDAMDARISTAEGNAGQALENSATAVTTANAAASKADAAASQVTALTAEVERLDTDVGTAITNSAAALNTANAAASQSQATADQMTAVQATLNTKNRTYRQNEAPTANLVVGDLWINTTAGKNNEMRRWSGTAWDLVTDPRIGDTATAVSQLNAKVNEQDGRITANANAITSVQTSLAGKADASALNQLANTVTEQGSKIDANSSAITALNTKVDGKADASALNALSTRVSTAEGKIETQGQAITQLQNSLAGKADVSALNALSTRVSTAEGKIETNTQAITALTNTVAGKADTSTVTQLSNKVTQQGDMITTQGQAITKVENNLLHAGDGTNNLLINSNVGGTYDGVSYPHVTYKLTEPFVNGQVYTLLVRWEHKRGTGDTNSNLAAYAGGGQQTVASVVNSNGVVTTKVTFTKNAFMTNPDELRFYMINRPTAAMASVGTILWAVLVKGDVILTDGWIPSSMELKPAITANTTAISTLSGKVTDQDGKITANTDAITSLNSVVAGKADASALNSLATRVTANEGAITSQGQAITNVSSKLDNLAIGGDNLVRNGDFSKATDWENWLWWGSLTSREFVTKNGKKFARLVGNNTDFFKGISQGGLTPFIQNTEYTVSFLAYTTATTDQYINFLMHQSGGGNNDPQINMTSPKLTAIPKRYSMTFTSATSDAKSAFNFFIGGRFGAVNDVCISDIQVEVGNKATAFKPNMSETANDARAAATAISKLQTDVTSLDGRVSAQATQITGLQSSLAGKADSSALNQLSTTVTQQGNTITSQGQAITQIESKVDNISVGGRNYLLASATGANNKTVVTAEMSKILYPATVILMAFDIEITTPVSAGSRNRIGFETSFNLSSGTHYCGVWLNNAASQGAGKYRIRNKFVIPATWIQGASVFPSIFPYINQTSGGAFTISNVKMEVGNVYTDWSPAPEDLASATALSTLDTKVTNVDGKVNAQATSITQLQTKVDGNTASIQQQATTIDGIKAQWTVKTDVNGYVAGIGLMNDGNTSEFIVRANRFAIANPTGTGKKYGFVYQSSPETLPNGTVVPAGLYIDNLMIGSIDASKIKANSIDAISANLGTFTSTVAGKGKTVITGSKIEVFDTNNVRRVFIGVE